MPVHLVPEEMLQDYARGASTPGVSLLVAAQLTHSPEGREIVREYERMGGAMLAEEDQATLRPDALDAIIDAVVADLDCRNRFKRLGIRVADGACDCR